MTNENCTTCERTVPTDSNSPLYCETCIDAHFVDDVCTSKWSSNQSKGTTLSLPFKCLCKFGLFGCESKERCNWNHSYYCIWVNSGDAIGAKSTRFEYPYTQDLALK